jgi:uncharacterized protein involved in exopolysaccharide biosynthesis
VHARVPMQTPKPVTDEGNEEIDLVALFGICWRYRAVILGASILGVLAALALALTATPYYRAEAVITEVQDLGMSNGAALENQLSGFAGLAGLALPSRASITQQDEAILDSRRLVEEFIRRNDLLSVLSRGARRPPTLWLAVKQFKEGVVTVHKDARKGVTTVALEWTDPVTAAKWTNGFVALANELIRRRALDESSRNIVYLTDQLARTNDVELRKVIYNIIESETRTLMLANGRPDFAFEVVDPAVPPEVKERPHRLLIVLVGGAVGLAIGFAAALILGQVATARRRRGSHASINQPAL